MQVYAIIGGAVAVLAALAVMLYLARKAGRDAQRVTDLSASNEVKDEQLDIANRPALTPDQILERMRKGGI